MNDYLKIKQLLGLCKRAGKLVTGESLTLEAIRKQRAKYVFVASDASEGTKKKMTDKSKYYNVPISSVLTSDDLASAIGQVRKIVAVVDKGFAQKIRELLEKKGD